MVPPSHLYSGFFKRGHASWLHDDTPFKALGTGPLVPCFHSPRSVRKCCWILLDIAGYFWSWKWHTEFLLCQSHHQAPLPVPNKSLTTWLELLTWSQPIPALWTAPNIASNVHLPPQQHTYTDIRNWTSLCQRHSEGVRSEQNWVFFGCSSRAFVINDTDNTHGA